MADGPPLTDERWLVQRTARGTDVWRIALRSGTLRGVVHLDDAGDDPGIGPDGTVSVVVAAGVLVIGPGEDAGRARRVRLPERPETAVAAAGVLCAVHGEPPRVVIYRVP